MRAALQRDDGFAMALVMGVIALITVLAIGGYFLAEQVLAESGRVSDESRAFQVAQSGLERELAIFSPSEMVDGSYTRQGSTPDGFYLVEASPLIGSSFEYVMKSTGTADGRTETVSQRFFYIDLWNMNIGAGRDASMGGGGALNGNARITGPLYVHGTLEWTADARYEKGPLFIRDGDLYASGNGLLGQTSPIDLFLTGSITGQTGNVYTKSISSSVPDVTLPWVDDAYMDFMLQRSVDESVDDISGSPSTRTATNAETSSTPAVWAPNASDYYKFIGDSGTGRASTLGGGAHPLYIGDVSFGNIDYPVVQPDGTSVLAHDDFAYDAAGTLYVEGTVFVDGDLVLGEGITGYIGNGTLVVNGDVWIEGNLLPRSGSLRAEEALGIVTPGDIYIGGQSGPARFCGALFANGTVGMYGPASNNPDVKTTVRGSILADTIYVQRPNFELETDEVLPSVLPESLPGAGGGLVFPGMWTRD